MGRYSRTNLVVLANANSDLIPIAGANVIQNEPYWHVLEDFLEFEDQSPNPLQHFFDPYSGCGIDLCSFGAPVLFTAPDRAEIYWDEAVSEYNQGRYGNAFAALGRVCHLVQDMGCPAHTLDDPHPDKDFEDATYGIFKTDPDRLHFYAIDHQVHSPSGTIATGTSIRQIMVDLAFSSSQWDSDDRCGHSQTVGVGSGSLNGLAGGGCLIGLGINGFISDNGLQTILGNCMPLTEQAMSRALVVFFATVRPLKPVVSQPQAGKIYSGVAGVPLHVEVRPPAGVSNLKSVRIEYRDNASLLLNQWHLIKEVNIVGDTVVDERWFNTIDSSQIKLRAVVVDTAGCESIPALVNIKIDSTPPQIKNTKP